MSHQQHRKSSHERFRRDTQIQPPGRSQKPDGPHDAAARPQPRGGSSGAFAASRAGADLSRCGLLCSPRGMPMSSGFLSSCKGNHCIWSHNNLGTHVLTKRRQGYAEDQLCMLEIPCTKIFAYHSEIGSCRCCRGQDAQLARGSASRKNTLSQR